MFPPGDSAARFVVAMGMAKNDIERVLRDVFEAREKDGADFSYRVRLDAGHLVDAGEQRVLRRGRRSYPPERARDAPEFRHHASTAGHGPNPSAGVM